MNNNNKILEKIQLLKKKAKNRRDLNRFKDAEKYVLEAIMIINTELKNLNSSSELFNKLKFQLSDSYGILGGINRRWGLTIKDNQSKFKKSFEYYDLGLEHETSSNNSYNLLNRVISRILFSPELIEEGQVSDINLKLELIKVKDIIETQLKGQRRRDVWALADLGLTKILLEEGDSISAFAEFVNESPLDNVYVSLFSTLEPLSKLNIPQKKEIIRVMEFLESKF